MDEPPYSLTYKGGEDREPIIVCAMFTPSHDRLAQRLVGSLRALGLQYCVFRVGSIHRSISAGGHGDISVSKPRFIQFLLAQFSKPVLYVDCDVVFRKQPTTIFELAAKQYDFAIYNWLADTMNDAWRPEPGTPLWKFYFRVDLASSTQLMASGAVQYWRSCEASMALLSDWELALCRHRLSEDDQCLDFAFNHGSHTGLKSTWLTKDYCRYAYWPYVDPVIDHPQFPTPASGQFEQLGSGRFDRSQLTRQDKEGPFPRDAVINTVSMRLLKQGPNGEFVDVGPLTNRLYLPATSVGTPP